MSYINLTPNINPYQENNVPNGITRLAAASFTAIANNNNFVLNTITYIFVTTLGAPTALQVHVKIQGSVKDTVKKLCQATRGEIDAANITYGSSFVATNGAFFTKERFYLGSTAIPAGNNMLIQENIWDNVAAITLSMTATGAIYAFSRLLSTRYVFSNNSSSITSPLQMLIPIGIITVPYSLENISIENISTATTIKEIDFYFSNNEDTLEAQITASNPTCIYSTGVGISAPSKASFPFNTKGRQIPAGYGLYCRCRSDGALNTEYVDFKFKYELITPYTLS